MVSIWLGLESLARSSDDDCPSSFSAGGSTEHYNSQTISAEKCTGLLRMSRPPRFSEADSRGFPEFNGNLQTDGPIGKEVKPGATVDRAAVCQIAVTNGDFPR